MFMKMKGFLITVLFFCVVKYLNTEEIFDTTFENDLDKFVEKTMECHHIPGLTLSVVKGSKTWTKGYGTADFSSGRMVDNTTQFLIGSVTKSFTMVLLGILLTEKGLDWDTKVQDIMGSEYKFVDEYRSKETTLKDMISHRTGLASLDLGAVLAGYPENVTKEQLCKKMKHLPQVRPFRDGYLYNNLMYIYLGHIVERLGGDSWWNLMKNKLLLPLGMTSTDLLEKPLDVLKDNVAKPYIFRDNKFQNGTLNIYQVHPYEPAGAILTTSEDIAKYIRFNLYGGTTENGKTLLNPVLFGQVSTSIVPVNYMLTRPGFPVPDVTTGYGLAWYTGTYRGYRKLWHSGEYFSYISRLWMYPDIKAGIFGNVNGPGLNRMPGNALRSILYYISDKLMGEDAWLNGTTECEFPQLWANMSIDSNPKQLFVKLGNPSEYTGVYGSYFLPTLKISAIKGNDSALQFQMNRLRGLLHSTEDKDRFLLEITHPWEFKVSYVDDSNNPIMFNSTFRRNKEGEVKSIEVEYEVKVVYSKDVSIFDDQVSGQAAILLLDKHSVIVRNVIVTIALVFTKII